MAFDPRFELRIVEVLLAQGVEADTVKMFGGITFMVHGNMSVGITSKGDFLTKFNPARHAEASQWRGAKPFTMGRGDNKGILLVDADAVTDHKALEEGEAFAGACARFATQGEEAEEVDGCGEEEVITFGCWRCPCSGNLLFLLTEQGKCPRISIRILGGQ